VHSQNITNWWLNHSVKWRNCLAILSASIEVNSHVYWIIWMVIE
jgi:hypothetical protein